MSMREKITVIILTFEEDIDIVFQCMENVKNFKVIIIDNSGNLLQKKQLEKKFKIFKYILNEKNYGYSKGNNQGIKLCDTEYALVLNPDCLISEENIIILLASHRKYKNCFITSPTTYDEKQKLSYNSGCLPENDDRKNVLNLEGDVCVESVLGAVNLFKKKDILEVGLFDENFFQYFSDFELCRRIKQKKKSVIQVFESKAQHIHGQSKVKNILKRIFIREYNYTFDELYYFFKINMHDEKFKNLKKKIPHYIIKSIINLFLLRLSQSIYYFSKIAAFNKFNKLLNKN